MNYNQKYIIFLNDKIYEVNHVYSILKTLNSIIPVSKSNIEESISQLEILSKKISTNNFDKIGILMKDTGAHF